ncbi:MAG: hypothetical protein F6J93_26190 [Oscillatoria sp. SIO1A7]|nr:hypothetical protein [Oscillatoria sp. SIO1A7]
MGCRGGEFWRGWGGLADGVEDFFSSSHTDYAYPYTLHPTPYTLIFN